MSRENVELVQRAFQEFGRGHFWLPDVFDPDVETVWHSPDNAVTRGIHALTEGWKEWLAPWADCTMQAEEFIDAGEHVVIQGIFRGRSRTSGHQLEMRPAFVWTMRNGKAVRVAAYRDRADALEAMGLRE